MQFEWDDDKARTNLAKHGVSFETATEVFDDPSALTVQDRFVDGEFRWRTVGRVGWITLMFVAHTYPDDQGQPIIRILSARKAKPHERRAYHRGDEASFR